MAGHMQQKTTNFWLNPAPMSLETYSFLYFYLCISVTETHYDVDKKDKQKMETVKETIPLVVILENKVYPLKLL